MTVGLAYNAQLRASKENQVFYSPEWMQEHIRSKGPFGEMYRVDVYKRQVRASEKLLQKSGITVVPVDLSEILGAARKIEERTDPQGRA